MDTRAETVIFAHRGASHIAPENTLEAFAVAQEMGANAIELDVQLTADDVLVVLHDDTVDRTSNGVGGIASLTLAQARALDFSDSTPGYSDTRIPTLDEALAWAASASIGINIEIKPGLPAAREVPQRVLNLVAEYGLTQRTTISCFDHEVLREVKRIMPGARVGALYTLPPYEVHRYAADNGFDAIHPHARTLKLPGDIDACHALGVAVCPWTVDRPEELEALMRAGVDGIITNLPDRAAAVRQSLSGSPE